MTSKEERPAEQGHEIALRLRAHPGRLRPVIATDKDAWGAFSLPLVLLAALSFESFFAQRQQRLAELALNVASVLCVLTFAFVRVRKWSLGRHDPFLIAGMGLLLAGAGASLAGLFRDDIVPEVMIKTLGAVMILFALDRMERREVVERLESSEEYLESFFESIPDPLVVIGEGRRVVAANRIAIAAFGEEILGKTCCETYLRHTECSQCTVAQAWNKRKPRFELVRDDKGARRFEVTTFPLFGPRGFSDKLLQQIKDVSAHAESEDRASLLGDVVNSVRDPVVTLGMKGELRHRNRATEAMFGTLPHGADPRGGDVLPFTREDDREAFVQALGEFVPWERETRLTARDGSERTATLALAPIRAVDDRLLGTVVIVRDVTDMQRLQEQLAQNEKLSALGEMVSGVAHELNNPLTAVFGFAQLLLSEDLPREQKESVRHIFTHAERCKKIIDSLLKFARRHKAEPARASLNEIVHSTIELTSYQLRLADVRVEVDLDPDMPESMMDSFQIQQVMINLLTNAQHAIEDAKRPGVVKIRTRRTGERMMLEIEDNGCGMSDQVVRRAFDPFFTTKGVGKGTGLGLSLSYGIVREHGGSLTAISRVGEGSTFRVELPCVQEPPPGVSFEKEHSAAASAASDAVPPIPRSRILVVDDEPIILELLQQFLRGDGHHVIAVGSGEEALREASRGEFDLVFSDWRMPGMGGEELYDRLCEKRDWRGRIVFLTGDAIACDATRVAQKEGNAVLHKPFTLASIRAAIARVCRPVEPVDAPSQVPARLL